MVSLAGLNAEVTGRGPHVVVLLHGFSDNLSTWRRVVPALAVRHRVVALDLPGHGESTRPWHRPLVQDYLEAVLDALDELGVDDPVSVVGNSMGAVVGAQLAAKHPERVDRLVLIGMPGVGGVPILWRAAASRPVSVVMRTALAPVPPVVLQRGFGWFYARAASPHPRAIDAVALSAFSSHYADHARVRGLSDLGRALLTDMVSLDLARTLAELEMPALRVWGRHDRLVPPHRPPRTESTVVLSGCGHCPQLDAPDRLLAVLMPFLADVEQAEAVPLRVVASGL